MGYLAADARDFARQGEADESIKCLEQWDLVARQLQVGVYIREFGVTAEQAKRVDDLREAIEAVRDDLRARKIDEANRRLNDVIFFGEYKACKECYAQKAGKRI